ncbi:MAG: alpha/beta hydrolase [Clostridiales bacterium]|jgi:pimeloyl-ACP methyl ester carboxylesterase|nr:alpha/beta hydrolase [Clostridiales bacterium]
MIDITEKVLLGGFPQKIHIRGGDESNPAVLFLHGGPGIPNRAPLFKNHADLCRDFIVVAWDQRGTGGSYKGVDKNALTPDRLVGDAKELVEYLCSRLNKERIFIVGGSWGSELGTLLVHRHPERIGAYIGYGQVVNGEKNEDISYAFSLEHALAADDKKAVALLKKYGPPVKGQYKYGLKGLTVQRKIMKKYGGHSMKKGGWLRTLLTPMLSRENTLSDLYGIIRGYKLVLGAMWPILTDYDFTLQCNKFEAPYYIFQGRHDNNTPAELIGEFYGAIDAPDKDLIWFENSAHSPLNEEPGKFKALMREKFLKK